MTQGKTELDGDASVGGNLVVTGNIQTTDGQIDCNGAAAIIRIGPDLAEEVHLGRAGAGASKVFVENKMIVGNTVAEGFIDASPTAVPAVQNLNIGTGDTTDDIVLGKAGSNTLAKGYLRVGVDGVCCIDAPTAADDLKVGSMSTRYLILSNNGQKIDLEGAQTRLMNHEFIVNDVATLATAGSVGMKANNAGHGNGPSIDFFADGAVHGWFDRTGFHW